MRGFKNFKGSDARCPFYSFLILWYGTIWYGMVRHGIVCGMVWCGMVCYTMVGLWYGIVWHSMPCYAMIRHGIALYHSFLPLSVVFHTRLFQKKTLYHSFLPLSVVFHTRLFQKKTFSTSFEPTYFATRNGVQVASQYTIFKSTERVRTDRGIQHK